MENKLNSGDAPVTKAHLKAEFGKLEEKMERLLSEQANQEMLRSICVLNRVLSLGNFLQLKLYEQLQLLRN
jgi:hypothetical protein